jgi:plasmid stability protein
LWKQRSGHTISISSSAGLAAGFEFVSAYAASKFGQPALEVDMRTACEHAHYMSKMVQIRNVPDGLHRKLKSRAADSGQTLSDFLLAELERLAARPTRDEMLTRVHSRKRVTLRTPAAVVIREERESA